MTADPRTFTVKSCDVGRVQALNTATQRNTFFSNLGKLGQIQAINQAGNIFSNISGGLNTLAQISNTVQQGATNSIVDDIVGGGLNALSSGANTVLSTLGINPNFVQSTLQNLNPGAANSAINTAENLAQSVSQGNFSFSDIPSALQSLNSVESSIQGIYPGTVGNVQGPAKCAAYPYAMDLIAMAPKFKFLFFIQFIMNSPSEYGTTSEFAFVIQESTRPQIEFDYEDVNYNNFRTKALKKTKFKDMKLKFFDDQSNSGMEFVRTYINQMIPITNITGQASQYQYNGMNFAKVPSSSSSPTTNDKFTPIKQINLFHVFGQGRLMNVYQFINPKVTNVELDELSMSEGDKGNMIDLHFQYDNVLMYPSISTDPKIQTTYSMTELTQGGSYPLQYVGGNNSGEGSSMSDVSFGGGTSALPTSSASAGSSNPLSGAGLLFGAGGSSNPLSGAGLMFGMGGSGSSGGGLLSGIGSAISGAVGDVTSAASGVLGDISGAVSGVTGAISNSLGGVANIVSSVAGQAGSLVNVANGLSGGALSGIAGTVDTISGVSSEGLAAINNLGSVGSNVSNLGSGGLSSAWLAATNGSSPTPSPVNPINVTYTGGGQSGVVYNQPGQQQTEAMNQAFQGNFYSTPVTGYGLSVSNQQSAQNAANFAAGTDSQNVASSSPPPSGSDTISY